MIIRDRGYQIINEGDSGDGRIFESESPTNFLGVSSVLRLHDASLKACWGCYEDLYYVFDRATRQTLLASRRPMSIAYINRMSYHISSFTTSFRYQTITIFCPRQVSLSRSFCKKFTIRYGDRHLRTLCPVGANGSAGRGMFLPIDPTKRYFNCLGTKLLQAKDLEEDNWTGLSDAAARRKRQNRLSKRAQRE